MQTIGLYIHIPFCRAKCPYCDFYSVPVDENAADRYIDAVCRAIETTPYRNLTADTLYLGGGTPSLMGPDRLSTVIESARRFLDLTFDAEITLEANPGTLQGDDLAQLRRAGFNRISFGVQSLQENELQALGRRHTVMQAQKAIAAAYDAGFAHISADLMLAIPHQTRDSMTDTIDRLTALPVDHISAYLLSIEPDTPFGKREQPLPLPDEDHVAQLYLDCVEGLEFRGYPLYEISNFAKPGGQCRHNLKYWRCEPYLGIGPAAHSFVEGQRLFFPRDLDAFISAGNPWELVQSDGPGGGFDEYAMLRLRLREGLDLNEAANHYPVDTNAILKRAALLEQRGLIKISSRTVVLTPQGFLLSNSVTGMLLYGN